MKTGTFRSSFVFLPLGRPPCSSIPGVLHCPSSGHVQTTGDWLLIPAPPLLLSILVLPKENLLPSLSAPSSSTSCLSRVSPSLPSVSVSPEWLCL